MKASGNSSLEYSSIFLANTVLVSTDDAYADSCCRIFFTCPTKYTQDLISSIKSIPSGVHGAYGTLH